MGPLIKDHNPWNSSRANHWNRFERTLQKFVKWAILALDHCNFGFKFLAHLGNMLVPSQSDLGQHWKTSTLPLNLKFFTHLIELINLTQMLNGLEPLLNWGLQRVVIDFQYFFIVWFELGWSYVHPDSNLSLTPAFKGQSQPTHIFWVGRLELSI